MVGCTRQSVNKLLGQFTDDGLVRLDREGIAVIGPGRADGGLAPLSAASARRRVGRASVSSRTAAAARAARERPIGPVRKTTRRTRRSPRGVDDRDRDGRVAGPRPGADRQPDLGAAELAGAPREADEVVGRPRRRPVVGVGVVGAGSPWAVAAGASGAIDSSKRTHGASPNSAVEAPARPDLDDRQRPAELAEPRADRLAPGRLAGRPDVVAEVARGRPPRPPRRASSAVRPPSATAEIRTSTASTRA